MLLYWNLLGVVLETDIWQYHRLYEQYQGSRCKLHFFFSQFSGYLHKSHQRTKSLFSGLSSNTEQTITNEQHLLTMAGYADYQMTDYWNYTDLID